MQIAAHARTTHTGFQRDVLHVLLLAGFDAFAIFEAFALAFAIRSSDKKPLFHYMTADQFSMVMIGLLPLWLAFFAFAGLYSVQQQRSRPSELGKTVVVVLLGVMALLTVQYFNPGPAIFPSRAVPAYAVPLAILFVFGCRQLVRRFIRYAHARGMGLRRVIMIGTGPLAQRISDEMFRPGSAYELVSVVCAEKDGQTLANGMEVLGTLDMALERYGDTVDEVVQAECDIARDEIARMMSMTTGAGIAYRFIPDQYGVYAASSTLTTVNSIPVMGLRVTALDGWATVGKRVFDLVGAGAIALLLSPVFIGLALAQKLTDPTGPIFYRQNRIGRGGAAIKVTKFRSMRWAYCTGPNRPYKTAEDAFRALGREDLIAQFQRDQKVPDDPRVSRLGRLLRRTSLDELPQLLDVFRGTLSLIGPRPVTPEELERYGSQRASFLALKPGITGLWQVSGRNDVSYDERVKLDVFYVENWSMKLDLTILAKTTTAVLAKKGAY